MVDKCWCVIMFNGLLCWMLKFGVVIWMLICMVVLLIGVMEMVLLIFVVVILLIEKVCMLVVGSFIVGFGMVIFGKLVFFGKYFERKCVLCSVWVLVMLFIVIIRCIGDRFRVVYVVLSVLYLRLFLFGLNKSCSVLLLKVLGRCIVFSLVLYLVCRVVCCFLCLRFVSVVFSWFLGVCW